MKRWNWTPKIYWVRLVGDENEWTLFAESCDPCYVCFSRLGTALVLALPYSLSFKPGHLSLASSTSMLASAAVWVLLLAGSLQSTFWILVLAPQVPSWAELTLGIWNVEGHFGIGKCSNSFLFGGDITYEILLFSPTWYKELHWSGYSSLSVML